MKKIKIGHDLVCLKSNLSLTSKRHGKIVLHSKEMKHWQSIDCCPKYYWICWSLKESLYKLNMKLRSINPLLFTSIDTGLRSAPPYNNYIEYKINFLGDQTYILIQNFKDYILTAASNEKLHNNLSIFTKTNVPVDKQSEQVRNLITSSIRDSSIEFESWNNRANFPILKVNGKVINHMDISFSHDGDKISACYLKAK